jgi:hypothetical protein
MNTSIENFLEVPCASIRGTWSLYEDFDPAVEREELDA